MNRHLHNEIVTPFRPCRMLSRASPRPAAVRNGLLNEVKALRNPAHVALAESFSKNSSLLPGCDAQVSAAEPSPITHAGARSGRRPAGTDGRDGPAHAAFLVIIQLASGLPGDGSNRHHSRPFSGGHELSFHAIRSCYRPSVVGHDLVGRRETRTRLHMPAVRRKF